MKFLPIIASICALALGACASLDHSERGMLQQHGVAGPLYQKMMHGEPLELGEIIALSQKGLPPRFILDYVHDTHFVYHLKPEDLRELQAAGVSRQIVDYLEATPGMYAPRIGYPYGPYPYGPYPDGPYPYGPYGYGYRSYGYFGPGPYYPGYRYHGW
jgi:hypothetical protein